MTQIDRIHTQTSALTEEWWKRNLQKSKSEKKYTQEELTRNSGFVSQIELRGIKAISRKFARSK